jgi:hypothetical protein
MFNKILFSIVFVVLITVVATGCGVGSDPVPTSNTSSGSGGTGGSGGSGGTGGGTTVAVTLTWDAPTTRADGSSLNPATDLSKYKLYYGTSPHAYTQSVDVSNPGTSTISKTLSLSPGTYYFVVTDMDFLGQESGYSDEISKTI